MRAVVTIAALAVVLGGCQQVTYPDGRTGYNISAANLLRPAADAPPSVQPVAPGQQASDSYVERVVPTPAIVAADRLFYEIGLFNLPGVLDRCAIDAQRGRGDIAQCWALDMHGLIVNTSEVNVRHRPSVPGLEPAAAHRRWLTYAMALDVPPSRYRVVENGTFRRVLAVANGPRQ